MNRKVVFLNVYSSRDYVYFLNFFKSYIFDSKQWSFKFCEKFEDIEPTINSERSYIVLDRSFHRYGRVKLEKIKKSLCFFDVNVVTMIKDQKSLERDLRRESILDNDFFSFEPLFSNGRNRFLYEYGQVFLIRNIFSSANVFHIFSDSEKENPISAFLSFLGFSDLNLPVHDYKRFSLISSDWFAFLYKMKKMIVADQFVKDFYVKKIRDGFFSGNCFLFEFEVFFNESYSILFKKRNGKLAGLIGFNLFDSVVPECFEDDRFIDNVSFSSNNHNGFLISFFEEFFSIVENSNVDILSILRCMCDVSIEYYYKLLSLHTVPEAFRVKPLFEEVGKHKNIFEKRGYESDLIHKVMENVIMCRRGISPDMAFFILNKVVEENIDEILSSFNIRYMVCIVDTYADYGRDETRMDFIFISQLALQFKVIETLSFSPITSNVLMTDGTDRYNIESGDAVMNLCLRFYRVSNFELSRKIFKEILIRYSKSENSLMRRFFKNRNMKKLINIVSKI